MRVNGGDGPRMKMTVRWRKAGRRGSLLPKIMPRLDLGSSGDIAASGLSLGECDDEPEGNDKGSNSVALRPDDDDDAGLSVAFKSTESV